MDRISEVLKKNQDDFIKESQIDGKEDNNKLT